MPNPYKVVAQATPNTLSQNLHDILQGEQILLSEVSEVDTPPNEFSSGTNPNFGDMETPPSLQVIFDRCQSILHPNFGGTSRDCSSACCAFDNDPPTTREKHRRIFGSFERPTNSQLQRTIELQEHAALVR
jgi:hypothetical protein